MEANKVITTVIVNESDLLIEDSDDNLSLRDLQIAGDSTTAITDTSSVSPPDIFEFFSVTESSPISGDIIFCGKLIPYNDESETNTSASSRTFNYLIDDERDRFSRGNRSENINTRSACSSLQKVNISSLTSMSPKARRRMFMFGPVKFKPEMELSAIRERQSRRAPGLMFPATEMEVGPVKSRVHLTDILAKSLCYR